MENNFLSTRFVKIFIFLVIASVLAIFAAIGYSMNSDQGVFNANNLTDIEDSSAAVEEDIDATEEIEAYGPLKNGTIETKTYGDIVVRNPKYFTRGESILLTFVYQPISGKSSPPEYIATWSGTACGTPIQGEANGVNVNVVLGRQDCEVKVKIFEGTPDEKSATFSLKPYKRIKNFQMETPKFQKSVNVSQTFEIQKYFYLPELVKIPINIENMDLNWKWESKTPACNLRYSTTDFPSGTVSIRADKPGRCNITLTVTAFSCESCQESQRIAARAKKTMRIKVEKSNSALPTPPPNNFTPTPTPHIETGLPSLLRLVPSTKQFNQGSEIMVDMVIADDIQNQKSSAVQVRLDIEKARVVPGSLTYANSMLGISCYDSSQGPIREVCIDIAKVGSNFSAGEKVGSFKLKTNTATPVKVVTTQNHGFLSGIYIHTTKVGEELGRYTMRK